MVSPFTHTLCMGVNILEHNTAFDLIFYFIIESINKHLLIGPDAYPLESIKLHIAWFARRDVAKRKARGNIAWLTGSDVRTSSNFAESIRNANGFDGIK